MDSLLVQFDFTMSFKIDIDFNVKYRIIKVGQYLG